MYAHTSYFLKLSVHVKVFLICYYFEKNLKLNFPLYKASRVKKGNLMTCRKYCGMQTTNY